MSGGRGGGGGSGGAPSANDDRVHIMLAFRYLVLVWATQPEVRNTVGAAQLARCLILLLLLLKTQRRDQINIAGNS